MFCHYERITRASIAAVLIFQNRGCQEGLIGDVSRGLFLYPLCAMFSECCVKMETFGKEAYVHHLFLFSLLSASKRMCHVFDRVQQEHIPLAETHILRYLLVGTLCPHLCQRKRLAAQIRREEGCRWADFY